MKLRKTNDIIVWTPCKPLDQNTILPVCDCFYVIHAMLTDAVRGHKHCPSCSNEVGFQTIRVCSFCLICFNLYLFIKIHSYTKIIFSKFIDNWRRQPLLCNETINNFPLQYTRDTIVKEPLEMVFSVPTVLLLYSDLPSTIVVRFCLEARSNTSMVALRVVGGGKNVTQFRGV